MLPITSSGSNPGHGQSNPQNGNDRPSSTSDDRRYPPPPPQRASFVGGHHLPPPIPSAPSPHSYPSTSGHTDPSSWASDRDRAQSRAKYSPIIHPSYDRPPSASSRLPPFDYPRQPLGGWDASSPSGGGGGSGGGGYATWATRPSMSSTYLPSPANPGTPLHDYRPSSQHSQHGPPPPFSKQGPPMREPSQGAHRQGSPTKHGASEEASGKKAKKRRVALSCAECAKRKQKCNRETPCQHCVARRVPELCVPYTRTTTPPPRNKHDSKDSKSEDNKADQPQSRPPSMLPTLSVRVSRIEALLNVVVNRVDGIEGKALSDWRINHAPATSPPPRHETLSVSRRDSVRDASPSPSPSPPPTALDGSRGSADRESGGDGDEVVGLDIDTSMRNPLPQSMQSKEGAVSLSLDYHGTPAEQLEKLFRDCGVSPEKVHEFVRELPDEEHGNRLLDWFFSKFNYVRYPIDEHHFRKSYRELCESRNVNARSVLFLPLVYIVFSISTRVAPDDWGMSEEDKRTSSLRYYWNSKNSILIAQAVKAETIQLVETKILTGLYLVLMYDRRLAESWVEFRSAIGVAQALGLHRDGSKLRLDRYTTEYRRRLWSYLVHADATYSCLLGRPTCLDPRFSDTRSPSNLDLHDLLETKNAQPKPLDEPTFATYLILRKGLGEIVSHVTEHFQLLDEPVQYRDVEAIDEEFKDFVANLPPAFRMLDPDRSWDDKLWYLPVHRYYIQTEILHFTIILHRPWLLRKLRSSRYALSRTACIEAAVADFKIRQAFKRDVPDFFETLLASSFREFNVAMIAGISCIIDPRNRYANEMKEIISTFLDHHPHDPSADDFSQKESAIIYTLSQRARELEEKRFADSISRPRSGSFRLGTQDNISAERHEPMPHPRKSPVTGFLSRQSPMQATSGTGSPDDDQPQQLLDHWLMSNTSFGPPLSSVDPSQMAYSTGGVFPGMPLGMEAYPQPDMWMNSNMGMVPPTPELGLMLPPQQPGFMAPEGEGLAPGTNGHGPPGMGGQWGDGNSVQYWNTLVDRIVAPGFNDGVPSM